MLPVSRKAVVVMAIIISALTIYIGIVGLSPLETYHIQNNNNVLNLLAIQNDELTGYTPDMETGRAANYISKRRIDSYVTDPPSKQKEMNTLFTFETVNDKTADTFHDLTSAFIMKTWLQESGVSHPIDIMKLGPFKFLPNYRNPCWKTPKTESPPIRCLPYFYLIGAPKSGTTDLNFRITLHQSVISLQEKESHWFNQKRFFQLPEFDDFTNYFINSTKHIYASKDRKDRHWEIFGDSTPAYMFDNDFEAILSDKNGIELQYTNADFIYHLYPKTKIMAMFRNPVDRLYSDYLFKETKATKSPERFHNLVVESIKYMTDCLANRTLRSCVFHPPETSDLLRLRVGIYFIYVEDFLRVFPKSQILILTLEEYSKHVVQSMEEVFKFLELEPMDASARDQITESATANAQETAYKSIGDMLPQTRELLRKFYFPYNLELSKLLGDKFNYNE